MKCLLLSTKPHYRHLTPGPSPAAPHPRPLLLLHLTPGPSPAGEGRSVVDLIWLPVTGYWLLVTGYYFSSHVTRHALLFFGIHRNTKNPASSFRIILHLSGIKILYKHFFGKTYLAGFPDCDISETGIFNDIQVLLLL
jgi:hypothetical protein